MRGFFSTITTRTLLTLLMAAAGLGADLDAQDRRSARRSGDSRPVVSSDERETGSSFRSRRAAAEDRDRRTVSESSRPEVTRSNTAQGDDEPLNSLGRGRYTVLIDLDENRLYFKQGELTLWSAPVGTGTGMRVITHSDEWEFTTPTGSFEVQYKERDPIWIAPDWYFVENNLPVPPSNHPSRYMRGTLGVAAVYISQHVAIHGTNRPELIGQRVSHGCIRLENRYALRLYHNVQVGTEVVIVGGEDVRENGRVVDLREGYDPTLASPGGTRASSADPRYEAWKEMDTDGLFVTLDAEMYRSARTSRWDEIALILVNRARADDEEALVGLLRRAERLPSDAIESEWGTYLADLYRNAPVPTLEGLSELDSRERRVAATMIVEAMLTLYNGDLDAPSVPWPTNLLPGQRLPRSADSGWEALTAAERDHRELIQEALARS